VVGLTAVDDRLFVLRSPDKQQIESYDIFRFVLQKPVTIDKLSDNDEHWRNGLTSCDINKCLYVSDYGRNTIHRVNLGPVNNKLSWSVEGGPCGLSVNSSCNLLIACAAVHKVKEFTADGQVVREVHLQNNESPLHAIQLTSDLIAVCCARPIGDIIEVDLSGQVKISYATLVEPATRCGLSSPDRMAVDRSNDCLFVADRSNKRIVSVNRSSYEVHDLSFVPDVRLDEPQCMCFDESRGLLYVGEGNGGRILVFEQSKLSPFFFRTVSSKLHVT
jgi:sugar lactone lactonase YvrE